MIVKLLTEHYLEFLSLKGGCPGSSESTLVKMPNCWKSHALAQKVGEVCAYNKTLHFFDVTFLTASNLCLLLQKEQNVKGGEGPSGKQAVGINNGTR